MTSTRWSETIIYRKERYTHTIPLRSFFPRPSPRITQFAGLERPRYQYLVTCSKLFLRLSALQYPESSSCRKLSLDGAHLGATPPALSPARHHFSPAHFFQPVDNPTGLPSARQSLRGSKWMAADPSSLEMTLIRCVPVRRHECRVDDRCDVHPLTSSAFRLKQSCHRRADDLPGFVPFRRSIRVCGLLLRKIVVQVQHLIQPLAS